MNQQKNNFFENRLLQKIRHSNRCGSHKNCIRVFKNNTYLHERTKFDICWKLRKEGYSVWTECIFTSGERADIVAINGREAHVIEIETPKTPKEMKKKLNQKYNYPDEFTLTVVFTDKFKMETFNL